MALVAAVSFAACGQTTTFDAGPDTGSSDAVRDIAADSSGSGLDVAIDSPFADVPATDSPSDDSPADVPASETSASDGSGDGASACSPTQPCHPYFCGCGSCNPADILCVSDDRSCPLGCPLSCPELATTVCECTDRACAVSHSDGGTSTDGGGSGTVGTPCSADDECMTGLLCCYPCGIPGCTNQCLEPMGGSCPLFP
jgi:hypothetical protein